jgi:hypothetical protein
MTTSRTVLVSLPWFSSVAPSSDDMLASYLCGSGMRANAVNYRNFLEDTLNQIEVGGH